MNENAIDGWSAEAPWIDRSDADIKRFLKSSVWTKRKKSDYSFDLGAALETWRKNGIVKFEQVVPHDVIDEYLSDIAHLKSNHMDYNVAIERQGQQTYTRAIHASELEHPGLKLNHMHTHSLAAATLSLTKEVSQFLSAIFEAPPAVLQSLTFVRGSQQPIHVDFPYVNAQTKLPFLAASWIPLEDVHPDSGPLAYYPGGHDPKVSGLFDWGSGSIVKKQDSTRNSMEFAAFLAERMRMADIKAQAYCPRKGDVLIWHANLPHEGTRILDGSRTRKSHVTHYTANQFFPERWLPKGEDAKERTVNLNGGFAYQFPWSSFKDRLPSWK